MVGIWIEDRKLGFNEIDFADFDSNDTEPADIDFGENEPVENLLAERLFDNYFGEFSTRD